MLSTCLLAGSSVVAIAQVLLTVRPAYNKVLAIGNPIFICLVRVYIKLAVTALLGVLHSAVFDRLGISLPSCDDTCAQTKPRA